MLLAVYQRVLNAQRLAIPSCVPNILELEAAEHAPDQAENQGTESGYKLPQTTPKLCTLTQ